MSSPVIILVRPQLVENIGTAARAMLNCGLIQLRLVAPRDPWPLASPQKERITAAASGADAVLENARLFSTTAEAVADLHAVYATTARGRDMVKPVLTPRAAIAEMAQGRETGGKTGILFGPERTGLTNEDLICAGKIITIPANPGFSSFNLAQGVLVLAYEWLMSQSEAPRESLPLGKTRPASKEELFNFFGHLEDALDEGGFFTTPGMKPAMSQNLRNIFSRASLTEQEVRTLHGVVSSLAGAKKRKNA